MFNWSPCISLSTPAGLMTFQKIFFGRKNIKLYGVEGKGQEEEEYIYKRYVTLSSFHLGLWDQTLKLDQTLHDILIQGMPSFYVCMIFTSEVKQKQHIQKYAVNHHLFIIPLFKYKTFNAEVSQFIILNSFFIILFKQLTSTLEVLTCKI